MVCWEAVAGFVFETLEPVRIRCRFSAPGEAWGGVRKEIAADEVTHRTPVPIGQTGETHSAEGGAAQWAIDFCSSGRFLPSNCRWSFDLTPKSPSSGCLETSIEPLQPLSVCRARRKCDATSNRSTWSRARCTANAYCRAPKGQFLLNPPRSSALHDS